MTPSRSEGKPTAAESRAAAEQGEQRVPRYTAAHIKADERVLPAYSRAAITGAFAHAELDDDEELTAAEAEKLVERHQKRTVDNADAEVDRG